MRYDSIATTLLLNVGALAAGYWCNQLCVDANPGHSMGPSAYCHSWTQQATISDWWIYTLASRLDAIEANKKETKLDNLF